MDEGEGFSVKFHLGGSLSATVEGVADDGNAETFGMGGVDTELVGASGNGCEFEASVGIFSREDFPMG